MLYLYNIKRLNSLDIVMRWLVDILNRFFTFIAIIGFVLFGAGLVIVGLLWFYVLKV